MSGGYRVSTPFQLPLHSMRRTEKPRPPRQIPFATPITSPPIQHHQALGMPEHTAGPRPRLWLLPDSSPSLCVSSPTPPSLSLRCCSCHPSLRFRFSTLPGPRWRFCGLVRSASLLLAPAPRPTTSSPSITHPPNTAPKQKDSFWSPPTTHARSSRSQPQKLTNNP